MNDEYETLSNKIMCAAFIILISIATLCFGIVQHFPSRVPAGLVWHYSMKLYIVGVFSLDTTIPYCERLDDSDQVLRESVSVQRTRFGSLSHLNFPLTSMCGWFLCVVSSTAFMTV